MAYLESVDNALRLLLLLARQDEVGVSEAAEELGVAPSTAHRLLTTLRYREFVTQTDSKGYRRGPAFGTLGTNTHPEVDLFTVARPHMERLQKAVDETCHLMTRVRTDVRFLGSCEAEQPLRVSSRAGTVLPAHTTSGGKVLLAELNPQEVDSLYPRDGVPGLGLDAAAVMRLKRDLRATRRRGYGLNVGQSERGIAAVAACVRDGHGLPVAGLSVSVPTVRYSSARIPMLLGPLQKAAQAIAADLAP